MAGGRDTQMTHEPLPWRNLKRPDLEANPWNGRGTRYTRCAGSAIRNGFSTWSRSLGIAATNHAFPDHHVYTADDVAFPGAFAILMTQKDAVKCATFADERFWYLPLRADVDPALVALVEEKIHGSQTA